MGEVIPFPTPKKHFSRVASKGLGVFVKPPACETAMYILGGNVSGFIDKFIAFHPNFSPELFGDAERMERGVSLPDNNPEPPSAA